MYHSFLIHSSAGGHLGCFHVLGIDEPQLRWKLGYTCLFQFWFPRITHLLKPVICSWVLGLLPCLDYCKQCCYEHWGAFVFFWIRVFIFFRYMPRSGVAGSYGNSTFSSLRILHLNAEFQRIARRNKKAFLGDQCKEIEENNRMRKIRDLFKKIWDTKVTLHAKMGTIKDRNGMDLTEAEDIKKRCQEYTEELYKKDLHDPDNHDGVITHLDILTSRHPGMQSQVDLRKHHCEQS